MATTQTYEEWCEEEEAIHSGSAIQLTPCCLCYLALTGKADTSPRGDQGPLRGIIRRSTSGGSDPYEVLHLAPCGHAVI